MDQEDQGDEQEAAFGEKEYGELKFDQARRFKELEHENTRLKRVVASLALDHTDHR